jgi:hypothetical protein
MELGENAMLAMQGKDKTQANKKRKGKMPLQVDIKKESSCFFYKKKGHMKKEYTKFQKLLERKVFQSYLFVINLIWLMLIITYSGLIMILQSIFQIPCRICET